MLRPVVQVLRIPDLLRLQPQVGEPLAAFAVRAPGRVVWVTPQGTAMSPATPPETPPTAAQPAAGGTAQAVARMAAFIQPGGARNLPGQHIDASTDNDANPVQDKQTQPQASLKARFIR